MAVYIIQNPWMLAENIVLYLQNTHFVLLFNILCIEFHETFCEASLYYSQHAGCKKLRYSLLWKGEKSHWCKERGWCKDWSMTVDVHIACEEILWLFYSAVFGNAKQLSTHNFLIPPYNRIKQLVKWDISEISKSQQDIEAEGLNQ